MATETPPDPTVVLDLLEAFRRSKTMFAAVALGVFDALAQDPKSAEALATALRLNADALQRLSREAPKARAARRMQHLSLTVVVEAKRRLRPQRQALGVQADRARRKGQAVAAGHDGRRPPPRLRSQ